MNRATFVGMKLGLILGLGAALSMAGAIARAAGPDQTTGGRVGVYDSRVVAFAHFWSEPAGRQRDKLMAGAREAKAAGDTRRWAELQKEIVAGQNRSHLQVFSTAPADEAMAALKDRLPAIATELGVTRWVSKWDDAALRDIPEARRVDVTERLMREFLPTPTEKQWKTIKAMLPAAPLPLAEARRLMAEGKL